ncbi:hypothetical protein RHMOL_Rhmol04G0047600 [Rhododendron molle]|uniref:Uncharacterized protein n=1 Tax=Rhododendron molle TaxID=49168 RepID=A0ACC0NY73_RHOML|nr:hypothetical protein RHMOL_Rhmol04G0047600 [Rhododendron molle]
MNRFVIRVLYPYMLVNRSSSSSLVVPKLGLGIVQAVNPFLFRFMPVTKNTSWVGEQAVPAEARVPKIDLPDASEDAYGGVIVDMKEPMNSDLFVSALRASTKKWREQGKKGIWIKLPIELVNLVEVAVKEGFRYHHAEPSYLMLVKWIPMTASTIPANASHRVGIGAFVTNSKGEVLVVQENGGKFKGTGVWKFPTGVVDEGEDICTAAMREVREETGIETEFLEVLAFRQSHNSFFGKSDLFFVCMLRPSSFDIQKQDSEIAAAKWMPLEEYAAQPFNQKHEQFNFIAKACLEKKKGNYTGFSAVPTTTGFTRKQNYLYLNKEDLRGTNICENSHTGKL